jgi:hypothetical protein
LFCFSAKTLGWFTKQSDFYQKTASKLASLDLVIYPGQAPSGNAVHLARPLESDLP